MLKYAEVSTFPGIEMPFVSCPHMPAGKLSLLLAPGAKVKQSTSTAMKIDLLPQTAFLMEPLKVTQIAALKSLWNLCAYA